MTNNEQDCADFKEFWGEEAVTRHYDDITDAELLTLQVWGACQAALKIERERQAGEHDEAIAYIKKLEKALNEIVMADDSAYYVCEKIAKKALASRPASLVRIFAH